ncbi:MAG TPA: Rnase Y domain-containing protein, partial [Thermoanaerobaculia bacterium]|nr:Rnase Y domain-containing protein [Thermoanaerobaculia bacterium]
MNTEFIVLAVAIVFGAVLVPLVWWLVLRREGKRLLQQAQVDAEKVVEDSRRQSETRLREADVAAKEKLLQARSEFEAASRKRRTELEALERRLTQKEDSLDKRTEELTRREKELNQQDRAIAAREKTLEKKEADLDRMLEEGRGRLEQIAGLTAQQARDELVRTMEDEARIEAAHIVKRIEDEAREQAGKQAQRIIGMAVQRSASDYVSETTVSVVMLPNDEMKGRIIGREGRNIRALETATGVDLIVDDTPEAVILSGFDPFRREVARVALERLIVDGRIHPARIEEIV